jgi:hypothetical protein
MAEIRHGRARLGPRSGAGLLAVMLAVSIGCQKPGKPAGNAEVKPTYNKDTGRLERITYDRNHDGKSDAWLFMNGARVLMAQLDENFDGTIDRWEYYGDRPAAGADAVPAAGMPALPRSILERAEQATRGDGKVNRREWYEKGQLARVEEDTTGSGHVDKWETWSAGVLQKLELDTKGAGRPDRRLIYPADGSAPQLEIDRNGDGTFTPVTSTR